MAWSDWFRRGEKASSSDALRAEPETKAAAPSTLDAIADTFTPGGSFLNRGSGYSNHRAQYAAFTGHQFTAISAIAKRAASQQLFVGRQKGMGNDKPRGSKAAMTDTLTPIPAHPLIQAINNPNPMMVRWSLAYCTVASLDITGRAFWWIRGDGARFQVWYLPATWVSPGETANTWAVRPSSAAEPFPVPAEEMAYFYLPDPADPYGGAVSPLATQSKAINADDAIQSAQYKAFVNGINPSVILKAARLRDESGRDSGARPILQEHQKAQLINAIRRAYGGIQKYGDAAIVDGLIEDIVPFSRTAKEMDFLNSGKQTRSRIFHAFGVNPLIVGEIEGANRAQAVVAEESFCKNVVNPLLELMGQVITAWLAPVFGGDLVAWFDPCAVKDDELQSTQWGAAYARGGITHNEYRTRLLGLPPVPWGDVPPSSAPAAGGVPAAAAAAGNDAAGKSLSISLGSLDPLLNPYTLARLRSETGDGNV